MRVLVTGAGGYLGGRVAAALLQRPDTDVCLWLHADADSAFEARRAALAPAFAGAGARVSWAFGELGADEPFRGVDPTSLDAIVHAAAVTRFNVDEQTAKRVNLEGTEKLLRFAERCSGLRALGLLSTLYATGLRGGEIVEKPLAGDAEYANHYERSKAAAERLLARHATLPWRLMRVATVIADDASGHVTQFNAIHNTLQLLCYGLISTVPGRADTPVYLVTGEMVAEAVVAILERGKQHAVYHLAHRRTQSLALQQLLELAWEAFAEDEGFRRRKLLKPLLLDEQGFAVLDRALGSFAGGVVNQALGSVSPFARQLFVAKDVHNENLTALLGRDPAPDAARLVRETCRYLVRTRWGKEAAAC